MREGLSYSEAGKLGYEKSKIKLNEIHAKKRIEYNKNPKQCLLCQKQIPFKNRFGKFCSKSCSASFNNIGKIKNIFGKNGRAFVIVKKQKVYCINCNIELTKNEKKYCSVKCQQKYAWKLRKEFFEKTGNFGNVNSDSSLRKLYKRYLIEIRGHRCEICNNHEWMGDRIPLIIDHINGDSLDYGLNNLRIICGNCDMKLPIYKNKNRGYGREYRRKRYQEGKSC